MIEKLTKAQEKKAPQYLNKWLKAGLSTKAMNKKEAKKAIEFLYTKIMKLEKPKYVIFLDSPMACQLAANLLKGTKLESKQLGSQLGSQLDSQLDSQLRSQLDSQLGSQLDSQNIEYFSWNPSLLWWPGWTGFYDFVLNEIFPKKKKEFKLFNELTTHWSNVHYYLLFPEIAFVSDFPKVIRRNEAHQLHDYNKPAIEYRDTYALYFSNGVAMTKEQIETPAEKITKEMFLSETNVDRRREISRKIGIQKTVEMLGAEVVDTYKSKVGGNYELLMIDFDSRGNKRPYLKMQNPSMKGVWHIEGVAPEVKTVKEAIMFRNKLTTFIEPGVLT